MALLTTDFFSDALGMGTSMTVVLPQPTGGQIGISGDSPSGGPAGDVPVLYLLHGLSDDHTAWLRYTGICRYAEERGLAVVMPAVQRSFYADEAHGHRYWRFVSEELPQVVHRFFRVSAAPADTFVAGLSMGGYGALKLALTHPHQYAAAASLSGVADIRVVLAPDRADLGPRIFDGRIGAGDDLDVLLDANGAPPLWLGCGTEDALLAANRAFAERAAAHGVEVTLDVRPGGHAWQLWDAQLPGVLDWLLEHRGGRVPPEAGAVVAPS